MKTKDITQLSSDELWNLSENDDVILSKDNNKDHRILINYKQYKILKDALSNYQQNHFRISDSDEFDLNPHLEDLNRIVKNGKFKDISDQPNYFENIVWSIKPRD